MAAYSPREEPDPELDREDDLHAQQMEDVQNQLDDEKERDDYDPADGAAPEDRERAREAPAEDERDGEREAPRHDRDRDREPRSSSRDDAHRRSGRRSSERHSLYVGNIASTATEAQLFKLFEHYGRIILARINVERDTGASRGFGFVQFEDEASAQNAMAALNGSQFHGQALRVELASSLPEKLAGRLKTNLYIAGFPENYPEEEMRRLASRYGEIASTRMMRYTPGRKGIGFVRFKRPEDADRALREMNNLRLDTGDVLLVKFAIEREARVGAGPRINDRFEPRDRDRDRDRDRNRDRDRDRDRDRNNDRDRAREQERARPAQPVARRSRSREREREKDRERDRDRERETERERERERERDRERDERATRDREREERATRDREREREERTHRDREREDQRTHREREREREHGLPFSPLSRDTAITTGQFMRLPNGQTVYVVPAVSDKMFPYGSYDVSSASHRDRSRSPVRGRGAEDRRDRSRSRSRERASARLQDRRPVDEVRSPPAAPADDRYRGRDRRSASPMDRFRAEPSAANDRDRDRFQAPADRDRDRYVPVSALSIGYSDAPADTSMTPRSARADRDRERDRARDGRDREPQDSRDRDRDQDTRDRERDREDRDRPARDTRPNNLYVSQLPRHFTKQLLDALFSPFGRIASSTILETPGGESRGVGFVRYINHDDCLKAIQQLDGKRVNGSPDPLSVSFAKERRRDPSPRRDRNRSGRGDR